ncbi:hypothetical protein JTE90_014453 [Oedothorax gibbosus]|uniref:Uncharacterized protein n=1 Tax=Oedothorax gibbosus TaxID=931172 RepID=A0AAV6V1C6_9ARAC|nr:hypothetical protein JTE90_014453 [Oedothorax gibbosus]
MTNNGYQTYSSASKLYTPTPTPRLSQTQSQSSRPISPSACNGRFSARQTTQQIGNDNGGRERGRIEGGGEFHPPQTPPTPSNPPLL